jgi:translocation protein SEC72
LLFIATSYFSFRNVIYFRRTGTMPDAVADPTFDAQTKAAFSSNTVHDFEEEDEFRSGRTGEGPSNFGHERDEDYALLQQSEADDLGGSSHHGGVQGAYDPTSTTHHGGVQGAYDPTSTNPGSVMHDFDTGYNSGYTQPYREDPGSYDTSYNSTTGYNR